MGNYYKYQHHIYHNQDQLTYGDTPPRVTIVVPDGDDFLPPNVPAQDQMVHI